jgi:hypothetical protein
MNEAAAVVVGLESPPFRHRHAASHLVFDTVCFAAVIRCVITSRATAVTPGNDGRDADESPDLRLRTPGIHASIHQTPSHLVEAGDERPDSVDTRLSRYRVQFWARANHLGL